MAACRPDRNDQATGRPTSHRAQQHHGSAPSNATLSQVDPGLPPHEVLRYRWKKGPWGVYDFVMETQVQRGMETEVQRGKQTQTTSIAARLRIRVAWVQGNHAHLLADFPAVGKTRPARALVRVSRALSHLVVSMDLDDRGRSIADQPKPLKADGNTRADQADTARAGDLPTDRATTGTDPSQARQKSSKKTDGSLTSPAMAAVTCPLPKAPIGPGARWTGRLSRALGSGLPRVAVLGRYRVSSIQSGLVTIDARFELDSAGALLPHRNHHDEPSIHGTGTGRWTMKADSGIVQSANSRFEVHVQSGKDQITVIQTTGLKRLMDPSTTGTSPAETMHIK